ncbi:Homoserine/homoserine lactone efflux protein [Hartmannibacter diazotrophicus]|uniref:Homoserine/homoserine lactone efflux protein n=1 Tax=Hartmannibacter diazotrophicus TaxID=1482074 RepID=A0A2C9D2I4_9HYPH|nr:LysE family translocator [Hartmannibacter diazotrophicus]SON54522.1 Homoserine/homoserine lactone efflux protein [Hartmannibacter diazotrophicus]
MTLMTLLSFALALAIAAAIPGPGVTAIVARALGCGFWGTLPMIIGLTLGDLIYLSCAIFGLAAIAKTFGTVFLVLKYLGGAYLLYLAVKLWRATPDEGLGATVSRDASPWRGFLAGLLVTLSNPKTMVFYLAFLPTFLDLAAIDLTSYVELCLAVIAVLLVVISAYALAAAKARALFRRPKAVRAMNRGAGAMMAGAAVAVVSR